MGRALEQLPPAHARALELWMTGASAGEIAADLGVADDAVWPIVGVGLAKLAGVVRSSVTPPSAVEP